VQSTWANDSGACQVSHSIVVVPSDFSLSRSPATVPVNKGGSGITTISTTATSGRPLAVSLAATGLPAGATATFNPASVTAGGSSALTLHAGSSTAAGSYTVTVTGTEGSKSHSTTVTLVVANDDFSIAVSPAGATVAPGGTATATVSTAVTSGSPGTVSLSVSGLPGGATAGFSPSSVAAGGSSTLTVGTSAATPVGTYSVVVTGVEGTASHTSTFTLAVGKADQTISFTTSAPTGAVVGGSYVVAATATSGLAVSLSIDGASGGACALSGDTVSFGAAGTCVIDANQGGNPIYNSAPQAQQTVAVARAAGSVLINNVPSSATYGGSFAPTYTQAGDGTPSTASLTPAVCSVSAASVTFVAAGACNIQASITAGTNYDAATGPVQNLTVGKADQAVTFGPLPDRTYGDGPFPVAATTSSGLAVTFSVGPADNCTLAGATVTITGAGGCTVTASQAGDANHNPATGVARSFAILKATLTVAADAKSKGYGDADPAFTWHYSGFEFSDGPASSGIAGAADCSRAAGESVPGSPYAITCAPGTLAAPNYGFATGVGAPLSVTKATLAVTADAKSKVYGDADPAFTWHYSGFKFVDGPASSGITGSAACSRTAGEAVPNSPFVVICPPGTLAAPNYGFSTGATATLTVLPATLTVIADTKSKVYGDADPVFTWHYSGFKFSDGPASSGIAGAADCSRAAGESVPGSPYAITCTPGTLAAPNYRFATGTTAALTVLPAPLTVTADAKAKIYGQPNPTFTVTYNRLVNGDTPASLGGTLTFSTAAGAVSGVGIYPVTASGLSSPNYTITFVAGSLTIGKANSATVLSSSLNPSVYGQGVTLTANAAPTPAGTGVATGTVTFADGATVLGTAVIASGTATLNVVFLVVATHALTATYNGDANVKPGSSDAVAQVVNKAPTTLVAAQVGRLNPTFTATLTRTFDHLALSGQTVTFSVSGRAVCSATTDANGKVSCGPTVGLFLGMPTYTATYNGNASYLPTSTVGNFK
ncbi:MAG: hypothetical protein QOG97_3173, partial [Acidimicrobiaceae bacterium]|nr:hypothetical protein [Acidimicrobiaceae bacterium]